MWPFFNVGLQADITTLLCVRTKAQSVCLLKELRSSLGVIETVQALLQSTSVMFSPTTKPYHVIKRHDFFQKAFVKILIDWFSVHLMSLESLEHDAGGDAHLCTLWDQCCR